MPSPITAIISSVGTADIKRAIIPFYVPFFLPLKFSNIGTTIPGAPEALINPSAHANENVIPKVK